MAVFITHLIISMVLVPYFLNILFGIPYKVIFLPRLISFILNVLIMNVILVILHKRIDIFSVKSIYAH